MNEDHGLATLQLVEQRRKAPIAEIGAVVVGQDTDSVETEGIEGMCDFPQRRIDIGQRQKCECAEPVRVRRDQRAGALVGRPGQFTGGVAIEKAECGRRNRQDGGADTVLVHCGKA